MWQRMGARTPFPVGQSLVLTQLATPAGLVAQLGTGTAGPELTGGATVYYNVTAVARDGTETLPATTSVTLGATATPVLLTWDAVSYSAKYNVYRGAAASSGYWVTSTLTPFWTDTGVYAATTQLPPIFNQTAQMVVPGPLTIPVGSSAYASETPIT